MYNKYVLESYNLQRNSWDVPEPLYSSSPELVRLHTRSPSRRGNASGWSTSFRSRTLRDRRRQWPADHCCGRPAGPSPPQSRPWPLPLALRLRGQLRHRDSAARGRIWCARWEILAVARLSWPRWRRWTPRWCKLVLCLWGDRLRCWWRSLLKGVFRRAGGVLPSRGWSGLGAWGPDLSEVGGRSLRRWWWGEGKTSRQIRILLEVRSRYVCWEMMSHSCL